MHEILQFLRHGDSINEIFKYAEEIAKFHASITSNRGDYFRKRLLGLLTKPYDEMAVRKFAEKSGIREYKRHIHKLINVGLVSKRENEQTHSYTYMRTFEGEDALNILRELERKIGLNKAKKIYDASLGMNSTRLFLKIFGSNKKAEDGDIIYSPLEIGQMASFLPRTVEGMAATDKLDSAGLVSYEEDGGVHVNPRRATAFYQYLEALYKFLELDDKEDDEYGKV